MVAGKTEAEGIQKFEHMYFEMRYYGLFIYLSKDLKKKN